MKARPRGPTRDPPPRAGAEAGRAAGCRPRGAAALLSCGETRFPSDGRLVELSTRDGGRLALQGRRVGLRTGHLQAPARGVSRASPWVGAVLRGPAQPRGRALSRSGGGRNRSRTARTRHHAGSAARAGRAGVLGAPGLRRVSASGWTSRGTAWRSPACPTARTVKGAVSPPCSPVVRLQKSADGPDTGVTLAPVTHQNSGRSPAERPSEHCVFLCSHLAGSGTREEAPFAPVFQTRPLE